MRLAQEPSGDFKSGGGMNRRTNLNEISLHNAKFTTSQKREARWKRRLGLPTTRPSAWREFSTGIPWEILYADDMMLIIDTHGRHERLMGKVKDHMST